MTILINYKKRVTKIVVQLFFLCTSLAFADVEVDEQEVARFRAYIHTYQKEHAGDRPEIREIFARDDFKNPPFSSQDIREETRQIMLETLEAWRAPECKKERTNLSIELLGELHTCPGCILQRQREVVQLLNDKNLYAHEGVAQDSPETLDVFLKNEGVDYFLFAKNETVVSKEILGIENYYLDGAASAFAALPDELNDFIKANPHHADSKFSLDLARQSFSAYSYLLFESRIKNLFMSLIAPGNELAPKILDRAKEGAFIKALKETRNEAIKIKLAPDNKSAYMKLFEKMHEKLSFVEIFEGYKELFPIYFEFRKKEILADSGLPPELADKMHQSIMQLYKDGHYSDVEGIVTTHLRNLSMATSIAKNYCDKSLEENKPLTVQLGSVHGVAVAYLLRKELKGATVTFRNIGAENLEKNAGDFERDLDDFLKSLKK